MSEAAFQSAVEKGMFAGLGMPPVVVELPWPDRKLSPNARVHWRPKSDAVKAARMAACWYTYVALGGGKRKWAAASLAFTFNPPNRIRRDVDNCIASTKAARDGIADALGIDDSKFECSYRMGEVVKGGSVRIEIKPI